MAPVFFSIFSKHSLIFSHSTVNIYVVLSMQKLQERKVAFGKLSYSENDRGKLQKALVMELMSSEESGDDDDTIVIKLLGWRSEVFNTFLEKLDEKSSSFKSKQAKRQTKERVIGEESARTKPAGGDIPTWVIKK